MKELQTCEEHCKIYLCGTKNDLVEGDRGLRQIDYHDAQDFAEEIGAQLFETSSKTGSNVDELFQKVAEDYSNTAFQYMTGKCFSHVNSLCQVNVRADICVSRI